MLLHRKHPSFTLAGELLCLLSCKPKLLAAVAKDLGLDTQRDLRDSIEQLQRNGHDLITEVGFDGRVIRIGKTWAGKSQEAANAYWSKVYEN